ncbi:MAG: response regulator, partial [Verrucomicrobia bacterium]|nr:response regulator [Verrucomicrobiota bacterium]
MEDHDDARTAMAILLGRLGANVLQARNGLEGLEAVKNSRPDLVITDLQMPRMNGFELLREIRSLQPKPGGNVPMIAMTSLDTRLERARVLNLGFKACVQKPFTVEILVETIRSLL